MNSENAVKYSPMEDKPPGAPEQGSVQDLEQRLAQLTQRVYLLESALRARGIRLDDTAPAPPQPAPTAAAQQPVIPRPVPPPAAPLPSFATHQPATSDTSLESRIGSQWFNRIGIFAVLIGMAWFLKFAIDNHWIGPAGRVLIGILAGAALIAWSERFRSHGFRAFSYSLKAIGSGVLYLSLWAAFSLFHLIPSPVAFAAMFAVTAFNGFMAWAQDSELLALYAIVGGYSTPLLLSTGQNHEVVLFSYLLLLCVTTLALIALRPWSRLLIGSFFGTIFFFISWSFQFYSTSQFGTTAFFLSLFFLFFAFAPHMVRLNRKTSTTHLAARDAFALFVLPFINAALGYGGFYLLVDSTGSSAAQPWIALAFAAFYLLLIRITLPADRTLTAGLKSLDLVIAVIFITLAIPLETHGRWLTIGWLVEGAALLWLSRIVPQRLLRALGLISLVLGLAALMAINPPASPTLFFNQRFATYLAAIAVFAFTAWLASRSTEVEGLHFPIAWDVTAALAALAVSALILIAVSLEIHSYWWNLRYSGLATTFRNYSMYAQFTYSAFFMVYGAILLILGFVQRSAFLRWQALILLAFSIGKVFTIDVSQLSQGYRILSFLGLGALLLAVSFAYQRDWLNLRKDTNKAS
ncbi:MAG TPA: DUF2339 domain-containing protein [Acidobacteriaceae bacterium]|nr:DUF2339 domain-containing protein [Acidobacteriaceae bacterium]